MTHSYTNIPIELPVPAGRRVVEARVLDDAELVSHEEVRVTLVVKYADAIAIKEGAVYRDASGELVGPMEKLGDHFVSASQPHGFGQSYLFRKPGEGLYKRYAADGTPLDGQPLLLEEVECRWRPAEVTDLPKMAIARSKNEPFPLGRLTGVQVQKGGSMVWDVQVFSGHVSECREVEVLEPIHKASGEQE